MSDLRERNVEINADYWIVRESQSERVAVAQLTLALAREERERREALERAERAEKQEAALRVMLARAAYVAEHLHTMIDRDTWRSTGGDDGQGHYEGDHRAEQIAVEIGEWKALSVSPPSRGEAGSMNVCDTARDVVLYYAERAVRKGYAPEDLEDAWDKYEAAHAWGDIQNGRQYCDNCEATRPITDAEAAVFIWGSQSSPDEETG